MNMRFNKQELVALASQPSQKFDKEGLLLVKEKQDGFFRRTESSKEEQVSKTAKEGKRDSIRSLSCVGAAAKVSLERWCRLRGNLFFYLRGSEQWAEPVGVIILEECTVRPISQGEYWPFQIIFEGGACYKMAALTEADRTSWLQAISLATYEYMKSQMLALQRQLYAKRDIYPEIDIQTWRMDRGLELDLNEVPICELSLSCDNLLCDAQGRAPSVFLVMHIRHQTGPWLCYATTEVIERSSNPSYLCTVSFRASDDLNGDTLLRITAYDMKETVSNTSVPMGSAIIHLTTIKETQRLRIGLSNSENRTVGFLTLNGWSLEPSISTQSLASPKHGKTSISLLPLPKILAHRRSQSLPPRLGVKIQLPAHGPIIKNLFANIHQVPYRFHSGLGGDITVHEIMMESKICFKFPQQLLGIFIQREKELLQEVICMGELGNQWKSRQMELLDTHLSLLKHYSHARQSLQQHQTTNRGCYFKQSCRKADINLEFAPVNLHIQRMWVHNDTLNKSGFYDFVTVGAFTAHTHKAGRSRGLIRLLQDLKASSSHSSMQCTSASRVQMASDAVQAIKILRRELVNIMRTLLTLSRTQETNGMMPLAEAMVTKTRALLSLWDPGLVEEALLFIDTHKVSNIAVEERNTNIERQNRPQMLSPFKRLTERLSMLDLKSPDLDDFATPSEPKKDVIWPAIDNSQMMSSNVPNVNDSMPKCMPNSYHSENNVPNVPNIDTDATETDKIILICDERVTADIVNDEKPLIFINDHFKNDDNALNNLDEFHTMKFHQTSPGGVDGRSITPQYFERTEVLVPPIPSTICRTQPIDMKGHSTKNPSVDTSLEVEFVYNDDSDMRLKIDRGGSVDLFAMSFEEMNMLNNEVKNKVPTESALSDPILKNFLDIRSMTTSPSANYYKPTDEPEPWDLTQLNIEASVMCLVSKVKFLCGRTGSPAVRLRGQKTIVGGKVMKKSSTTIKGRTFQDVTAAETRLTTPAFNGNVYLPPNNSENPLPDTKDTSHHNILESQQVTGQDHKEESKMKNETVCQEKPMENLQNRPQDEYRVLVGEKSEENIEAKNIEITKYKTEGAKPKKGINKFTDGLNLADVTDWPAEMRPSMRKLRQAMDGLLKTGRLAHAALRLRCETPQRRRANAALQIRRDTCFSQALTAVTTGLLLWLWSTDPAIVESLLNACLGPLVYLEGLLSLYASEVAMWGDMVIAIEDLHTVVFTLTVWEPSATLMPQIFGTRNCLNVTLPVPETLYSRISCKQYMSFTITAVYFNVGINEKANLAETLGNNIPQEHSNSDNFDKFNKYYNMYKKVVTQKTVNAARASSRTKPLEDIMDTLSVSIQKKIPKNVEILELAAIATRQMNGIRVTSCKSAKDRTAMSCTLEQCRILSTDYHLAEHEFNRALHCMRSEGCRRQNTLKNTGIRRYAFNKLQVMALPKLFRPPQGTYGSVQT